MEADCFLVADTDFDETESIEAASGVTAAPGLGQVKVSESSESDVH